MKEEQHIQDLFRTIRELPPEVELSAIEKFVLAQPAAAFQPPTGGGSSLLTIKNSIIMISSISIIGSAVIFFSGGNIKPGASGPGSKPVHQQTISDSSILIKENISDAANPTIKKDVAVLPVLIKEEHKSVQNNMAENSSVSEPKQANFAALLISCDDKEHITSRFVEAFVKEGLIDPKLFSLRITHKNLVINNRQQSESVFKKYKELFEKLSGGDLSSGTSLSVSVVDGNCSSNLSTNNKINKQSGETGSIMMDKLNGLPMMGFDSGVALTSNNINTEISWLQSRPQNMVNRNLSPFSAIVLQSGGSVQVEAGDTYSVSLLGGGESAFEKVKADVRDGILYIEKEGKTKGKNWLVLQVTVPADKLVNLTITGSGNIEVGSQFNGLNQLVVDGSGNILIDKHFDAGNDLRAAVTGSGTIQITDLKAKNVLVAIPGSGVVIMGGMADDVKASITGSGSASLDKLNVQRAVCSIDGSGVIEVTVDREITISISGSGAVSYRGNPKVTQSVTGSGIVEKKE